MRLCCRAVIPGMLERDRGRIVITASAAAYLPGGDHTPYPASNAGVCCYGETLARSGPSRKRERVQRLSLANTALQRGSARPCRASPLAEALPRADLRYLAADATSQNIRPESGASDPRGLGEAATTSQRGSDAHNARTQPPAARPAAPIAGVGLSRDRQFRGDARAGLCESLESGCNPWQDYGGGCGP